jgi:hypothetical protein
MNDFIKKLRKYRIFNIAIFDIVSSFVAAYFIAKYLEYPVEQAFLLVIPISILTHILFNIKTPFTTMFLDPKNYYPFKILVIFLFLKGSYYEPFLQSPNETSSSTSTFNGDSLFPTPKPKPKSID